MLNSHFIICQYLSSASPKQHSPGQLCNVESNEISPPSPELHHQLNAFSLLPNSVAQGVGAVLWKFSLRWCYSHHLNRACFCARAVSLDIKIDYSSSSCLD